MKHVAVVIQQLPENDFIELKFLIQTDCNRLRTFNTYVSSSRELRQAKWEQFDFVEAVWIRPSNIMKKGIEHGIPLSKHVIKIIDGAKENFT